MMSLRSLRVRAAAPSARSAKPARVSAVVVRAKAAEAEVLEKKDVAKAKSSEKDEPKRDAYDPTFSSKQVAEFLRTVVEETDFMEVELQVGSFELKVKRSMSGAAAAVVAAPAAVHSAHAAPVAPAVSDSPGAVTPPASPHESIDESIVPVTCGKVGIFRRGRYAAGKRVGKGNVVEPGDQVKKGAPLGFIEQLGTHFPVEATQAGEVARFKIQDGEPCEYGQVLAELSPFFGGHIIGDKKYA
ncbi:hypothetical protein FOA52_001759 [Chlamydomonas sp. UWO 241]|nr:hypothetical protein FOA52_001759 [Chlamydomonas sp. UWO 241]